MNILSTKVPESVLKILDHFPQLSAFNAVVACTAAFAFLKLIRMSRRRVRTYRLKGPPNPSFVYGAGKIVLEGDDQGTVYESWAKEYGAVFEMPTALGSHRIVLYDLKALAHFHSKDTWTYAKAPIIKKSLERGVSSVLRGWLVSRQRKSLTPAFSVAALRNLVPIFYDSAYKAKGAWNALIESSGQDGAIIEVQNWWVSEVLDTMGLAGFSHNFGALEGKQSPVGSTFDSLTSSSSSSVTNVGLVLLTQVFPILLHIPTSRSKLRDKLHHALEDISNVLLARTKKEFKMSGDEEHEEKSIIGLLIKGESVESEFHLSKEEVIAQMKVLILAGYETTSSKFNFHTWSSNWALIELSLNPDIQMKLRNELLDLGSDPTYDQLTNNLPYLDAVVHEVLRLHAPIRETIRVATEDDLLPLSEPVRTKSGELIESLPIAAGTSVVVPMSAVNCSNTIWGEDAKIFKPGRWVAGAGENGIPTKAREVRGHRHLLTFSDGPRTCLGKNFAIAEFKAVLSVLVKNFVFELRDGPDTKIEMSMGILPRPRVAGEEGCKVPLRVKPYIG
ncbi:cytochrome P450 [Chiua virens]|nr:cytochrome P450 [Chiua virens]